MSVKELSLQLFELGVYHKLEDINSVQILTVNDGDLSSDEAHILHTLISEKDYPETAVIALKILANHFEVNPIESGNFCRFKNFKE